MTPTHPAVLNPVDNWHLYLSYMRGIENKDGQLISEPSCSHVGFCNTVLQLHCTPNGSYAYLHQIAIKSTSLGL